MRPTLPADKKLSTPVYVLLTAREHQELDLLTRGSTDAPSKAAVVRAGWRRARKLTDDDWQALTRMLTDIARGPAGQNRTDARRILGRLPEV